MSLPRGISKRCHGSALALTATLTWLYFSARSFLHPAAQAQASPPPALGRREGLAAMAGSFAGSTLLEWSSAEASVGAKLTEVSLTVSAGDDCKKPFDLVSNLRYDSLPVDACTQLIKKTPVPGTKYPTDIPATWAKLTCTDSKVRLIAYASEACTGVLQDVNFVNGQCTKLPNIGSATLTWSGGCGQV
mmetsp:Transcript_77433/g.201505  ORF Transcript_77433/g.201505 Transcript_77433/m.201505 type:complete len:189 (+) Transcript_77433:67-633(+)